MANILTAQQASFEDGTTTGITVIGGTVVNSTAAAAHGTSSLLITADGSGNAEIAINPRAPVVGGNTYSFVFTAKAVSGAAGTPWINYRWYDAAGVAIGSLISGSSGSVGTSFGQISSLGIVAPSNAASVHYQPRVFGAAGQQFYMDKLGVLDGTTSAWTLPTGPRSIQGLKVWLEADTITGLSDGAAVSTWPDDSRYNHPGAQATGVSQPLYKTAQVNGLPAVKYDGSNDQIDIANHAELKSAKFTAFYYVRTNDGSTGSGAGAPPGSDDTLGVFTSTTSWNDGWGIRHLAAGTATLVFWINNWNNASLAQRTDFTTATWHTVMVRYDLVNASLRIDGNQTDTAYTTAVTYPATAAMSVGAAQATYALPIDLAEFLFYDRELTTAEIAVVESYLTAKYVSAGTTPITAVDAPTAAYTDASAVKSLPATTDAPTASLTETSSVYAPNVTVELWENGAFVATLGNYAALVENVLSATFNMSVLADPSGAGAEIRITGVSADIAAVEWNAAYANIVVSSGGPTLIATTDVPTMGYTEGTSVIAATLVTTDVPTMAAADVSTVLAVLSRTDAPTASYADTSAVATVLATTDPPTMSYADVSAVAGTVSRTDAPTMSYADTSTVAGAVATTDTPTMSYIETSAPLAAFSSTDIPTISYVEVSVPAAAQAAVDAPTLATTDVSTAFAVVVPTTDAPAMTMWENPLPLSVDQMTIETSATGWTGNSSNVTVSRTTAFAYEGIASLVLTSLAAGTMFAKANPATTIPASPGQVWTLMAWFRADTVPRNCELDIIWRDSGGVIIGQQFSVPTMNSTSGWTLVTATGTAPALTAFVNPMVQVDSTGAAGEVHYVDRILLLKPNTVVGTMVTTDNPWLGLYEGLNVLTANQSSFEAGVTTGWAVNQNCSLAATQAASLDGAWSLLMTATVAATAYSNTLVGTSGFPVIPGATYNGLYSIKLAAGTARAIGIYFSWYTAAGAFISSTSGPGGTPGATWQELMVSAPAPATAAFGALNVQMVSPLVGDAVYIDRAAVYANIVAASVATTDAPTLAAPEGAPLLTANQQSFEAGTAGIAGFNATIAQVAGTGVVDGAFALKVTSTINGTNWGTNHAGGVNDPAVVPGQMVSASGWITLGQGVYTVTCGIDFFNSGGGYIGGVYSGNAVTPSGTPQRSSVSGAAIAGAAFAFPTFRTSGGVIGDFFYVDAVTMTAGAVVAASVSTADVLRAVATEGLATNLLTANQGGLEIDLTGWATETNASVARGRAVAFSSQGVQSQYLSTPAAPVLDVTGDLELMARVICTLPNWASGPSMNAPAQSLISKWSPLSYRMYLNTSGTLIMATSTDGGAGTAAYVGATASLGGSNVPVNVPVYLKGTFQASTGRHQFFWSLDNVTYTKIGADVFSPNRSIFAGTAALVVGNQGTVEPFLGQILYAEVRNGIGGPIVASFDGQSVTPTGTRTPTRTNLMSLNQEGVETDTTGFGANNNATYARSTAQALTGAASLAITVVANSTVAAIGQGASRIPCTPGVTYTATSWWKAATTGRLCRIQLGFYTSAGVFISQATGTLVLDTTTGWTQTPPVSMVAPATAATMEALLVIWDTVVAGEVHYVDQISIHKGTVTTPWTAFGSSWDWVEAVDDTIALDGKASLESTMITAATAVVRVPFSGAIPVTPGQAYICEGWFRAAKATNVGRPGMQFNWVTAGGGYISSTVSGTTVVTNTGWTRSQSIGVAPPTAAFATPGATFSNTPAAGEVFYGDRFSAGAFTDTISTVLATTDPPTLAITEGTSVIAGAVVAVDTSILDLYEAPNLYTANQSSFETDTTGWGGSNCTVARDTTQAFDGGASMRLTNSVGGVGMWVTGPSVSGVVPGQVYSGYAWFKPATHAVTQVFTVLTWLDAASGFLSNSVGIVAEVLGQWVKCPITAVAPAGAAKVRIQLNVQDATQTLGEQHYIDKVWLSQAPAPAVTVDTTDTPTLTGVDLPNPVATLNTDFDVNVSGWSATGSSSIVQTTAQSYNGTGSLQITSTAASTMFTQSGNKPVVAGMSYTATARVRAATVGRQCQITIRWYDAGSVQISNATGSSVLDTTSGWSLITTTGVAPANATQAALYLTVQSVGSIGEVHYLDAVTMLAATNTVTVTSTTTDLTLIGLEEGQQQLTPNQQSIEIDFPHWSAESNCVLFRSTTQSFDGSFSLGMTVNASTTQARAIVPNSGPVDPVCIPGQVVTVSAWVKSATASRIFHIEVRYGKADSSFVSGAQSPGVSSSTTGWTKLSLTTVAPAGTERVRLKIDIDNPVAGEIHYVDLASITIGNPIVSTLARSDLPTMSYAELVVLLKLVFGFDTLALVGIDGSNTTHHSAGRGRSMFVAEGSDMQEVAVRESMTEVAAGDEMHERPHGEQMTEIPAGNLT